MAKGDAIDFAADVMLILAWYKALDDVHDEGSRKAAAFLKIGKKKFQAIRQAHEHLCSEVKRELEDLSELEDEKCANLDMAAEAFAKIMESIFKNGISYIYEKKIEKGEIREDEMWPERIITAQNILGRVGYHLGKWIYLMDAFDDIEENIESGAYNPLLYRFEYKEGENPADFRERIRGAVERNLVIYLSEMGKAFDLADIKKNRGIIENIVYVGLLKKTEEILNKGKEDLNESI